MSWGWRFFGDNRSDGLAPFNPISNMSAPKPDFDAVFNAVSVSANSSASIAVKGICEEPPDRVSARYRDDLNILAIHDAVLSKLDFDARNIGVKRGKISELASQKKGLTINGHREIDNQISELQKDIAASESGLSKSTYLTAAEPLLAAYREVTKKRVFSIAGGDPLETSEKIEARCEIIEDYLDIARKWIIIDISRILDDRVLCPSCGRDQADASEDSEGMSICDCGYATEILSNVPSYKDSQRVNSGCRNNYEDRINFHKAFLRYQGKQPRKPPSLLYSMLDDYVVSVGGLIGDRYRAMPQNASGQKDGTSKHLMIHYLQATGNSAYYDDINIICHVYWGWTLQDLGHLEEQIMTDYDRTQEAYNLIPNKDRIASLNIQFRLYVHLKALDVECDREDFKIQVQRESLLFHQECWNQMCAATATGGRIGVKCTQVI